jgi:plasmid stabilization system protein ParE
LDRHADRGAPAGSPDIRRLIAPFGRTGYVVIYHFEPGSVTVLRIFHAREDR